MIHGIKCLFEINEHDCIYKAMIKASSKKQTAISVGCMLFESDGQIIGVTKTIILMFSFTVFKVNITTS